MNISAKEVDAVRAWALKCWEDYLTTIVKIATEQPQGDAAELERKRKLLHEARLALYEIRRYELRDTLGTDIQWAGGGGGFSGGGASGGW